MHGIERHVLLPLPTFLGIDLSITNEVLLLWIAALLTGTLLWRACRRTEPLPRNRLQNLFEAVILFIEKEVVRAGIGAEGPAWSPFLLTLFFFILSCNLLGMLPAPAHVQAVTANLSVTLALALVVFGVTILVGFRRHGLVGFLRKFVPTGVPRWIAALVVPIEVVSWLAKPLSLALRLFANMLAGHSLIFTFVALEMTVAWFLIPLPLVGAVAMSVFELFVCVIQAFIFTLLAGLYIKEALESRA